MIAISKQVAFKALGLNCVDAWHEICVCWMECFAFRRSLTCDALSDRLGKFSSRCTKQNWFAQRVFDAGRMFLCCLPPFGCHSHWNLFGFPPPFVLFLSSFCCRTPFDDQWEFSIFVSFLYFFISFSSIHLVSVHELISNFSLRRRPQQAVIEKFAICEENLSQLLRWITEVEYKISSVGGPKERIDELRNQINLLKVRFSEIISLELLIEKLFICPTAN